MGISFQSSLDFIGPIRDLGCEYLSCLAMAVHYAKSSLSTLSINAIWKILVEEDLANSNFGLHSALSFYRTFDLAFDFLNKTTFSGDQVGAIIDGKVTYWGWVQDHYFNYAIRRMVTANGTRHSVLLNQDFIEIYNPAPEYSGGRTVGIFLFQVVDHAIHTLTSH